MCVGVCFTFSFFHDTHVSAPLIYPLSRESLSQASIPYHSMGYDFLTKIKTFCGQKFSPFVSNLIRHLIFFLSSANYFCYA